jgi:hypothetical protein
MTLVRIIKDWDRPDLMRQTPGSTGIWDGCQFTVEPVAACDYGIVLNRVREETVIRCPPGHIWALVQEPPIPEFRWLRKGFGQFSRVFTPDVSVQNGKVVHSHGALPWHVDRDYDHLKRCPPPEKPKALSWITSNAGRFKGHKKRLAFLQRLQREVDFDLWGRGFRSIPDKWDGLAPYRYALAVENYRGPHYWSEKLADCFLAWTMPIYCGCINIAEYFPRESFVSVDIESRDAVKMVKEAIRSDLWLRNRDAVARARELVLEKYQFFPFVADRIWLFERGAPGAAAPETITLKELPQMMPEPLKKRFWWRLMLAQRTVRDRVSRLHEH